MAPGPRGGRGPAIPADERTRVITRAGDYIWGSYAPRRGDGYKGCPPGLARKYNGCMPPGLARPPADAWYRPTWYGSDWGQDYRYVDGYLLRTSGSSVLSYIPLLGGALAIGQVWPSTYEPVALPPYYADYYDLGPADSYRYYDDTIYGVDPGSSQISNVLALLTGSDIAIGEPMPAGYDIYNVPYEYRDRYYDTPEANYRYSDGTIYQVDPTTQLVQAAIELLTKA